MKPIIHSREVYLASHHIKTVRYGIPIWDAVPDSEKQGLPPDAKSRVMFGLYVHDISKIVQLGWTDELLFRDKHPTPKEWEEVVVPHPDRAREILESAGICDGLVLDATSYHHVREDDMWFQGVTPDGSTIPKYAGYPMGVIGALLPFHKSIVKCPDAISSMEEYRNYRAVQHTPQSIFEEVRERSGTEYKPVVAEAFCSLPEDVRNGIFDYRIQSRECAMNIEARMMILQAAACRLEYLRRDVDGKGGITPTSPLSPQDFGALLSRFSEAYGLS